MNFTKKKYLAIAAAGSTLAVVFFFWKMSPLFSNDSKIDKNTVMSLSKSNKDLAGNNHKPLTDSPQKLQAVRTGAQFRTANPFDTALRRKVVQSTDFFS